MHEGHRARLLLLCVLLSLTGCRARLNSAIAEAPRKAVPAAIDEVLIAGEDPVIRARFTRAIAVLLETPEMQRAIAEVAKVAVAGAFDQATTEESEQRIKELTKVVSSALAESLAQDVVPAVMSSARESLNDELSPEEVSRLEGVVTTLTSTATRAAMRAAASEIPTTVGPAVRQSLAQELRSAELRAAVSVVVNEAARQAVASSRQAMVDLRAEGIASGTPGPIEGMRLTAIRFAWLGMIVVAALVVGLAVWFVRSQRRAKRYRAVLKELIADRAALAKEAGDDPDRARVRRLLELLA
jgi:hypothetical protein